MEPGCKRQAVADPPARLAGSEDAGNLPARSDSRCVLLIDDDPSVRGTLAHLLRHLGYRVEEAEGGLSGLARLAEVPVDLVLTDLGMPGLSGWDVARIVKTCYPGLPVVLITGWASTIADDQPERSLVASVLEKPCQIEKIRGVIERLTPAAGPAPGY